MSLEVRLMSYQGGGTPKGEKVIKAGFRGVSHLSKTFEDQGDWANIRQVLTWPIASALHRSEEMELHVMAFNRFLNNKLLGSTTFSLHRLLDESPIHLSASLVDPNGRPMKASLNVEIHYRSPFAVDTDDSMDENDSGGVLDFLKQQDRRGDLDEGGSQCELLSLGAMSTSRRASELDMDEQRALLSIQKNIDNYERAIASNGEAKRKKKRNRGGEETDGGAAGNHHVRFQGRMSGSHSTSLLDQG